MVSGVKSGWFVLDRIFLFSNQKLHIVKLSRFTSFAESNRTSKWTGYMMHSSDEDIGIFSVNRFG